MNAITYKEIFPLIKNNELWLGTQYVKEFVSDSGEVSKFGNILWYTNLDHNKRHQPIPLYKHYNPDKYPKYDNYNAIEVSKTKDIPMDYDGVMGVPVTFMDRYCPEQFEIVGSFNNSSLKEKAEEGYVLSNDTQTIINGVEKVWNGPVVNKQPLYKRICIKLL
jgi:hypothetical protein